MRSAGRLIYGQTKRGAKAAWKYGVEEPYRIVDRTIPSPIPYAKYVFRNPDEIIELATSPQNIFGAPLAAIIADSRNKVLKGGTRPLPIEVRAYFKDTFSEDLLDSVRYTTGNSAFNGIATGLSLNTQAAAITLINVVVFKDSSGSSSPESIRMWAHELYHVRQYEGMGLMGFAGQLTLFGYKNKESPIEAPAYRFDKRFSGMIDFATNCPVDAPSNKACWTEEFSEEQPLRTHCGSNMAVAGLWCSGSYCDNKSLYCKPLPSNSGRVTAAHGSKWISEEKPNASFRLDLGSRLRLLSGLRCRGRYCDNLSGDAIYTDLEATGQWEWLPFFSEEQGGRVCEQGQYVTGVGCKGSYCDNISLHCSSVR